MYHGVGHVPRERDPHGMFVTPASFRAQLEWLLENGFQPLSEAAFLAALDGAPPPRKGVLITFDDGYLGVGEYAAPVLAELGVPALLFVPSRLVGERSAWLDLNHQHPLMTRDELFAVREAGIAIGAHGLDHGDLTTMDFADLVRHTADARAELAAIVAGPVRTFAYPFGSHHEAARDAARDAGYEAAFAVHDDCGRFAIARTDVNATDTPLTFRVKLHPAYPAARRASRVAPYVRRAAHRVLGRQR